MCASVCRGLRDKAKAEVVAMTKFFNCLLIILSVTVIIEGFFQSEPAEISAALTAANGHELSTF